MFKQFFVSFILILVLVFSFIVSGQYYDDYEEYEVPFVPTDDEIVAEMLKIANVNESDLVYDLGCGDGRIVITAAKKYGAKGIGIDINPVRIKESIENARKEGVTDKVRFIEQDLFEADIKDASVVAFYLLQSVNIKLRPKLLRELKPGTRVVSHNYHMEQWKPDQKKEMFEMYEEGGHTIYFWIIPADVGGTW